MNFNSPEWLYIGLAAAILIVVVYKAADLRRKKLLSQFASARLLPQLTRTFSGAKMFVKNILFLLGVICVFIALARPQWGYRWEETKTRGIDIVFAIDTSKSMLAEDVKPNRLERAKLSVMDLVNSLKGDRIGIVAFSGQSFLQCPLTLDYDAFKLSLDALDTDIIKRGGTNIAAAIAEAEVAFANTTNKKIIVLISDGEELESSAIEKAEECAKRGVIIYTLGVGGTKGNQIPVRDAQGRLTYVKDEFGNAVTSKLNEEVLEKVAKLTGGFYEPLSANGMDMIYQEGLKKIPQHELSARMKQLAIERFQLPLLIAIILLALESLVGTRKFFANRRGANLLVLCALALFFSSERNQLCAAEDAQLPRALFNEAVDEFEKANLQKSKEKFIEAIKSDEEMSLHAKAFFNIAAADYKLAQESFQKARPADELANADKQIIGGASQAISQGMGILQQGGQLLKEEEKLVQSLAQKSEEEKKAAMQKSPLRNQQFQQTLKQEISKCEGIEKSAEELSKKNLQNLDQLKQTDAILQDAIKDFKNALTINPNYERAQKNFKFAQVADKNLQSEIEKAKAISSAFSNENGSLKNALKNLKNFKEELKKLVRDDNQQNQNQQQDQQQDQQNKQDKNQQNKDQQNQQQQQNQQDQNKDKQENQQQQNQNQQDKKDQQKQDSQKQENEQSKPQEQNKDKQEQKNQEQGKDEKKENQQTQKDNGKDEQAVANEQKKEEQKENSQANQPKPEQSKEEKEKEEMAAAQEKKEKEAAQQQAVAPAEKDADEKQKEDFRKAVGAMSRGEARQLLDSLKGDEKSLPHTGFGEQRQRYEKSYKDW